jgi:hypothetical protein
MVAELEHMDEGQQVEAWDFGWLLSLSTWMRVSRSKHGILDFESNMLIRN